MCSLAQGKQEKNNKEGAVLHAVLGTHVRFAAEPDKVKLVMQRIGALGNQPLGLTVHCSRLAGTWRRRRRRPQHRVVVLPRCSRHRYVRLESSAAVGKCGQLGRQQKHHQERGWQWRTSTTSSSVSSHGEGDRLSLARGTEQVVCLSA